MLTPKLNWQPAPHSKRGLREIADVVGGRYYCYKAVASFYYAKFNGALIGQYLPSMDAAQFVCLEHHQRKE